MQDREETNQGKHTNKKTLNTIPSQEPRETVERKSTFSKTFADRTILGYFHGYIRTQPSRSLFISLCSL